MQKMLKSLTIVVIIIYLPLQTLAWGVIGHRVIGEIADKYLTSSARRGVKALLGNESVGMASNWMDFIKSDSTFDYLETWHYLNMGSGISQNQFMSFLAKDTSTNAYTKINFLTAELKNKSVPVATRASYLKMLIHLVGDIHQPMHVGRPEDRGGNNIKVTWFNENSNLHQVWDTRIINFQQLSYTEYVNSINFVTKGQKRQWQKQSLSDWLWESYQYTQEIYGSVKQDEKLGYNYNYKYISVVNQQLLKGGVRLAGLLNEIFR